MEFEAIAIRGPCCSIRYTSRPRTFSCNSISCNSSRARSRPARPLLGLLERSFSMRRSAASTRSRARSRSNRVYRRGSDSIRFFRDDARSPNGRRMSLRPTPVDFFAISASLHAPRLRRRETEYSRMRPKRRLLKAMRPSRDHPETCGRVGVNFVKSEKRADREPQKRLHRRF